MPAVGARRCPSRQNEARPREVVGAGRAREKVQVVIGVDKLEHHRAGRAVLEEVYPKQKVLQTIGRWAELL